VARGLFRVRNETRGAVLAERAEKADNMLARAIGLMGRSGLPEGGGLIIDPCKSITMFFMRFPIDVVFVDRDGKVVHLIHGIKPWRNSRIVGRSRLVVELPAGTLAASDTQTGDEIDVSPSAPVKP
jgi:uncharacterized membrane protein (UPF0127 family)